MLFGVAVLLQQLCSASTSYCCPRAVQQQDRQYRTQQQKSYSVVVFVLLMGMAEVLCDHPAIAAFGGTTTVLRSSPRIGAIRPLLGLQLA
jgi:Na+-translocating ferredoxin:NAD+ oxidoreductase RnfD subunit